MKKFEIFAKLAAIDKASEAIKRVGQSLRRLRAQSRGLGEAWGRINTAGGRVLGGMRRLGTVGVAAAGAFGLAMNRSVTAAGDLDDAAQKLGLTTDALQELRFAGQQNGIALNTMDMAMQRFTRRLGDAAGGAGPAKDAFGAMGVKIKDASGKLRPAEAVLGDVADAMAKIEDPALRVKVAFALFDSEGVAMVNVLGKGGAALAALRREAHLTGNVLSKEQIEVLAEVGDEVDKTRGSLFVLQQQLMADFGPAVIQAAQALRGFINENRTEIIDKVREVTGHLGAAVKGLLGILRGYGPVVQAVAAAMGGWENVGRALAVVLGVKLLLPVISLGTAIAGLGGPIALLAAKAVPAFFGIAKAVGVVGTAFKVMAIFAAANPVMLAVMAIAGAAALIVSNWGTIGPWFAELVSSIGGAFEGLLSIVRGIWASMKMDAAGAVMWILKKVQSLLDVMPDFMKSSLGIGEGLAPAIRAMQEIRDSAAADRGASRAAAGLSPLQTAAERQRVRTEVVIRGENLQRGTRVEVDRSQADATELDVGYSLAGR